MTTPFITIFGMDFNIYGIVLMVLVIFFLFALRTAHKTGQLVWVSLITNDDKHVSTTKILQIIGGVVGTWIVIQQTLQGKLTWDLFACYLAYVASVDGFNKYMISRGPGGGGRYINDYSSRDVVVDPMSCTGSGTVINIDNKNDNKSSTAQAASVEDRRAQLRDKLKGKQ